MARGGAKPSNDPRTPKAAKPAGVLPAPAQAVLGRAEQADVVAGLGGVGSALIRRAARVPSRVRFSVVGDRAILEGDIDLGVATDLVPRVSGAIGAAPDEMGSVVITDASKRWQGGVVPFEPPPGSSPIAGVAAAALQAITDATSVEFRPRLAENMDYVVFEVAAYCSSRVGRHGGRQVVKLSPEASVGNAIHELCHVLGLWHEQSREDRDRHVRVRWENILAGYDHNFRQQLTDGDDIGPYDYDSIMHYPFDAFSVNGAPTLEAIPDGGVAFGQRERLSAGDVAAIESLYAQAAPVHQGRAPSEAVPPVDVVRGQEGVQFEVEIVAGARARVKVADWPAEDVVVWDVVPVTGFAEDAPLLSWSVEIGRSAVGRIHYFFTIENLRYTPIRAQARYVIVGQR